MSDDQMAEYSISAVSNNGFQDDQIPCQTCGSSWELEFLVRKLKHSLRIDNGNIYYEFLKTKDFLAGIHIGTGLAEARKGLIVIMKCPDCAGKDVNENGDEQCLFCVPSGKLLG